MVASLNDVSVGRGTRLANITKVNSNMFVPDVANLQSSAGTDAAKVVTVHYVKKPEQLMEFTCLVALQVGWPHPKCPRHSTM